MRFEEAELNLAIEAELRNVLDQIKVEVPEEVLEILRVQIRATLRDSTDPKLVLRNRLKRIHGPVDYGEISKTARDDRALWILLVQLSTATVSLQAIAERELSTEENPIYAGGVESPGNRIHTPAEMARNALDEIDSLRLDPHYPTGS